MGEELSQKSALRSFYASESSDRTSDAWLSEGGSAAIPENAASRYFLQRKVDSALAMAGAPAPRHLLEVGSSWGHQTFLLAERLARITAVDLSPESIALAQRRAARWSVSNVSFQVGDAEELSDHADAQYDAVFSFSTVRFCPHPERALAEMHRVLAPGGRVVVDFPNADCPWYGPLKRQLGIDRHIHDRLFRAGEAVRLVEEAGFEQVQVRFVLFTSKRVPSWSLPGFRLIDAVGERLPGVRNRAGIVMVSGRKRAER